MARPEWLREALAEDDRFRAEREYEEQRAAGGLMYKTTEAPRPEPTPELPGLFDDPEQDKFFADVMARVISKLQCEFKREVRRIESKIRAALVTELSLRLDEQNKLATRAEGEVIDLPKDFWRRDLPRSHDAA
jgi:hypothetical protein